MVYRTHGAGIVTEDGTESFNVFDHNFAMRSGGSGDFAPRSGYSGAGADPGGEGAGFWFRGPNNSRHAATSLPTRTLSVSVSPRVR